MQVASRTEGCGQWGEKERVTPRIATHTRQHEESTASSEGTGAAQVTVLVGADDGTGDRERREDRGRCDDERRACAGSTEALGHAVIVPSSGDTDNPRSALRSSASITAFPGNEPDEIPLLHPGPSPYIGAVQRWDGLRASTWYWAPSGILPRYGSKGRSRRNDRGKKKR